jgi:MFS family permease
VLLGAWCFFMKEPPRGVSDDIKVQRKATAADYKMLARIPSYTINCAAMTAMTFAIGGIAFWLPNYLDRERGIDPTTARLASGGIVVVAGLFATILGGIAGDRLRPRYGGSYFLVSAAGMLAGFPLFLAVLIVPFPLAWVFLFLAVFCLFFNTGPSNTALANVSPPAMRATAFALNIFAIHALGDAISPPIMGWIADRWSMSVSFGVVSVMFLIGGGLWLWGARYLAQDTMLAPSRLEVAQPQGFEVTPKLEC